MKWQPTWGTSKAATVLQEKLEERDAKAVFSTLSAIFTKFAEGANEMMKMNNPHRDVCLEWWCDQHIEQARTAVGQALTDMGIFHSYMENMFKGRMRQASEHGAIVETLKERDPDWHAVTAELRKHRQWEDKQDREGA